MKVSTRMWEKISYIQERVKKGGAFSGKITAQLNLPLIQHDSARENKKEKGKFGINYYLGTVTPGLPYLSIW